MQQSINGDNYWLAQLQNLMTVHRKNSYEKTVHGCVKLYGYFDL